MLSEISSLKNIFKTGIVNFELMNNKCLTDLINTLLDLQHGAVSLTAEANEIFSPPNKPNLSPIPSAKRLSTSSSESYQYHP